MFVSRITVAAAAAVALLAAQPASAQFFFKPPDLKGGVVNGDEPGIVGGALPGAKPEEYRAALVWNLRAALNVAALQCQFEPMLLTVENYNALIKDHDAELDASYATLGGYFARVAGNKKAGQDQLDRFGTRVYSGFSTISAQYTFCQTASEVGQRAIFAPRGALVTVAQEHMRELRNSLQLAGEQQFPGGFYLPGPTRTPPIADPKCWTKQDALNVKRCGTFTW